MTDAMKSLRPKLKGRPPPASRNQTGLIAATFLMLNGFDGVGERVPHA